MATVVFFHAHPDDEAIATGGTMAALADAGHRVVLVTATRGRARRDSRRPPGPGETLAERREVELDEAVPDPRRRPADLPRLPRLGHGRRGHQPPAGAFAAADVDEAAAALAAMLDEEGADVLVIYDEHGGYGHPDHVQVHRVGMAAAELAATPVRLHGHHEPRPGPATCRGRWPSPDWEPPEGRLDGGETMGEPASRITTEVDVTPWIERKRRAMRAHASQISEDSFFLAMPDEVFADGVGPGVVHPDPARARASRLPSSWEPALLPRCRRSGLGRGGSMTRPPGAPGPRRPSGGGRAPARAGVGAGRRRRPRASTLVNSFAVDDNVYLVLDVRPMTEPGLDRPTRGRRQPVRLGEGWMETTRFRPDSLAR